MTNKNRQAVASALKKVGKAIWSAIPWVLMTIALTCWFMLPVLYAEDEAKLTNQIAALEAEKTMYESENKHLTDEIEWLRSFIKETKDGQIQQ